jgi:4-amino-4-deoxy-L-arabinose transferase-like glycosyltransferase
LERVSRQADGHGHRALAAILVASFALKLLLLIPAHQTYPIGDARDYLRAANQFRQGRYTSVRPPLWPATMAAAGWVASWGGERALTPVRHILVGQRRDPRPPISDLDMARFFQVVLSTLTVWVVFLLGRELFDRRAGLVAAGCFAFYPNFVAYTHLLYAETQLALFNATWLLLLLRGARSGSLRALCAAGVALGLAALSRQLVFSFVLVAAAWLVWFRPDPWRRTLPLAAAFVLATVLTILPWTVRNAIEYGQLLPIAPTGGWALLHGVTDDVPREVERAGIVAAVNRVPPVRPIETDRMARKHALGIIRADPAGYLRRTVRVNVPDLWRLGSRELEYLRWGGGSGPNRLHGFRGVPAALGRALIALFVAAYLATLAGAAVGAALAPRWRETLLPVALVAHGMAMHAIVGANLRHRLYFMLAAVVYAGFAWSRRREDWRALLTPRRAAVAAGALAFFVLVLVADGHPEVRDQWRFFGSPTSVSSAPQYGVR